MTGQPPKAEDNNPKQPDEPGAFDSDEAREAVEALRRFRKGKTLGGLSWKELRDEGRK